MEAGNTGSNTPTINFRSKKLTEDKIKEEYWEAYKAKIRELFINGRKIEEVIQEMGGREKLIREAIVEMRRAGCWPSYLEIAAARAIAQLERKLPNTQNKSRSLPQNDSLTEELKELKKLKTKAEREWNRAINSQCVHYNTKKKLPSTEDRKNFLNKMAAIYNSNGKIPIFYTNFALELIEGCPTLLDGEELRNIGIILKAIVMNTYANQSKDAASNVTSRLKNVLDNGIVHDALYEIYVRLKGTQSTLIDFRDLESIRKWGSEEFSQMMDTKFGLGENSGGDVR